MNRISITKDKKHSYDIVLEESFDALAAQLEPLQIENRKICIVTDTKVVNLYGKLLEDILQKECKQACLFSFPAGEKSKNLNTVNALYAYLIEHQFERNDLLIALGGGVVGDLTGFTAATYLRGIDFIQIPTTLLSQVDSSIGGKTGVDFQQYKNIVGAFYMPKLVYINLHTLDTLEDREYFSGFAEVMKAALIKDVGFYEWLLENLYEICDRKYAVLETMISRSCEIKKEIVEKDPYEKGDRALLNFGHTIGHAIEKAKDFELLHGECVALGCVAAAYISWKKEYLSREEYYEVRDMFVPFNLPITIEDMIPEEILKITSRDKKMEAGKMKFILLKKIGKALIDTTVTKAEMLAAIEEINYREEDSND